MRRTQLKDCSPRWVEGGTASFECPEANGGCGGRHAIPGGMAGWTITGPLETLTIVPSIKCSGACRIHIIVTGGVIEFCGDSKSGPEWNDPKP